MRTERIWNRTAKPAGRVPVLSDDCRRRLCGHVDSHEGRCDHSPSLAVDVSRGPTHRGHATWMPASARRDYDATAVTGGHGRSRNPEVGRSNEFQFGIRNAHLLVGTLAENRMIIGGVDGTRTRDPRRDRPVF